MRAPPRHTARGAAKGVSMRCTCQNCGEYMVQDEKGLSSRCICPQCFSTCSACMGTVQQPLSKEALSMLLLQRERYDEKLEEANEE